MRAAAVLCCLVAAACGSKKKDEQKAEPAPTHDAAPPDALPFTGPGAPLWKLAPAKAAAGVVIPDGGLARLFAVWDRARELAAPDPYLTALAGSIRELVLELTRVDIADADARSEAGIDPALGVAIFFDEDLEPMLAIVPSSEPDGGAFGGTCKEVADRTLCAADPGVIDDVAAADDLALLARQASELPDELRGEVEAILVPTRVPAFDSVRERLSGAVDPMGRLAGALRLADGRARVRFHLAGELASPWATGLRAPSANVALDAREQAAATALRVRIDPALVRKRIASLGLEPGVAKAIAAWTGDVLLVGRGSGLVAGELVLGMDDPDAARAAVPAACNALLRPFGPIQELSGGVCRVAFAPRDELASTPLSEALMSELAGTPLGVEVDGPALVVSVGSPGERPAAATTADRDWQLVWRGRALDPLATAPDALAEAAGAAIEALDSSDGRRIGALRWLAAQLAELSLGLRVAEGGIDVELEVIPFAADPPAAFAAHQQAIERLRAGDRDGYRTALIASRPAHPGTLLARHADAVLGGAPTVGPGTVIAAVAIPALVRLVGEAGRGRRGQR